jgi:hypothetical protein
MAPRSGLTRTEQIVARAEEELNRCSKDCVKPGRDLVIGTALIEVQRYADMLDHQATFVRVSRLIFATVMHALGKLDFPVNRLEGLNRFGDDINTLVHSTSNVPRK